VLAAARGDGRGRFRGKGGHLLLPPHPSTALPRQCYEHTFVYKKVTRFCLARHLWTSLYHVIVGSNSYDIIRVSDSDCMKNNPVFSQSIFKFFPSSYPSFSYGYLDGFTMKTLRAKNLGYHLKKLT